jgi:YYY domain-containing protein
MGIVSAFLYNRNKNEINKFLKEKKGLLIFEELVFWSFFASFILIRLGNPDLWHPVMGGEKPMDLAFLNAIVRTNSLPPFDPWLSGDKINYYYFGQFITATLTKLLNIPSGIFYNLFLCYIFGQAASGAASIVFSITKSKTFSILGSIFLLVCGNLAQIPVILQAIKTSIPINGWYWTATRVMPNYEINEFPFFTFLYADLHSHLFSLPIGLLIIYMLLEIHKLIISYKIKASVILSSILALLLGIIRITNIWDYPSFLLFSLVVLFSTIFFFLKIKLVRKILFFITLSAILIAGSNLFILPFVLNYKTGPLGLDIYLGPGTNIKDYFIIHGFFILIFISFVVTSFKKYFFLQLPILKKLAIFIPIVSSAVLYFVGFYFFAFLLLSISLGLIMLKSRKELYIPSILFIFAFLLTLIPDLVELKLGLGRMNTVFKFYFQSWIFFALGSAIAISIFFETTKRYKLLRNFFAGAIIIVYLATLTYAPTATVAKIRDTMSNHNTPTLNGTHYMRTSIFYDEGSSINLSYDLEAIEWINKNIQGAPVVLEATTPIYRWGSRVSIYTGLPTVLGWDWHEIAHRQYLPPDVIKIRSAHIQQIYENTDFETTKSLLLLYNVSYIYLGKLEQVYYRTSGLEGIISTYSTDFKKVYDNPEVRIYKFLNGKLDQSQNKNP